jgi:hypothetical protein
MSRGAIEREEKHFCKNQKAKNTKSEKREKEEKQKA